MAKPVRQLTLLQAGLEAFSNVSAPGANAVRAKKVVTSTFAHTALGAVVLATFPGATIRSHFLFLIALGASVVARFFVGALYRPMTDQNEKRWAAGFSFMTLLTAVCWSALACSLLLAKGILDHDTIVLLVMLAGISGAGASSLPPDRALARSYVGLLLLPAALIFGLQWDAGGVRYTLVIGTYFAFLIQQIEMQTSILRKLIDRRIKYSALSEATHESVIIHQDGVILEVNRGFEREFGFTNGEITGRQCLPLVENGDQERGREILKNELDAPHEMTFIRKDGTKFRGEVYARFFDYHGVRCKMVCIQNVSYRARAEEIVAEHIRKIEAVSEERSRVAVESARLKAEFLANMSHEIRTPLNAIIGITELLGDTQTTDVQKRYLRTMSASSELLLTLINDVLDFSKIDAGKLELESLQFSVASVIESQADLLSARALQKGIGIVTAVDSDLPAVFRGDAGRIAQVLLNLIGNAIKFTAKGHVEVRASSVNCPDRAGFADVRFEVVDTGEGLSTFVQERLFQPFMQADSSTSRKHGGTGLGLSICKRLVEAMGGTIGVESSTGVGSKFWFSLPLEVLDAASTGEKFSRDDWALRQIFVVSDENSSARSVGRYLQSWGMTATIGSSNYAPVVGQKKIYDAVIASSSFIRNANFKFDGPIIEIQNENGLHAETAGVYGTLSNPVRQSDLYNVILRALKLDRAGADLSSTNVFEMLPSSAQGQAAAAKVDDIMLRSDARVLVAEDNSTNQMLALAQLRKLGLKSHPVSNGLEALEALGRGSYDLILMDCQMPEMDGFEATRKIREIEKRTGLHIPIVALTANAFEEDRRKCLEVGMDAYLAKPLRREQLTVILKQFLGRKVA